MVKSKLLGRPPSSVSPPHLPPPPPLLLTAWPLVMTRFGAVHVDLFSQAMCATPGKSRCGFLKTEEGLHPVCRNNCCDFLSAINSAEICATDVLGIVGGLSLARGSIHIQMRNATILRRRNVFSACSSGCRHLRRFGVNQSFLTARVQSVPPWLVRPIANNVSRKEV